MEKEVIKYGISLCPTEILERDDIDTQKSLERFCGMVQAALNMKRKDMLGKYHTAHFDVIPADHELQEKIIHIGPADKCWIEHMNMVESWNPYERDKILEAGMWVVEKEG